MARVGLGCFSRSRVCCICLVNIRFMAALSMALAKISRGAISARTPPVVWGMFVISLLFILFSLRNRKGATQSLPHREGCSSKELCE